MLVLLCGGFVGNNFIHNILHICMYPHSLYKYFQFWLCTALNWSWSYVWQC